MAKKKAKWLEEATVSTLVSMLVEVLSSDEADVGKAQKIAKELQERIPEEVEAISVMDALANLENMMANGIAAVEASYEAEVSAISGDESEDEEDEDEAPVKEKKSKKGKKNKEVEDETPVKEKKSKKGKKAKEVEPEEDEDEDESEGSDYDEMSQKDLKKECRTRGIKVTKSMKKSDYIKALEADDKD